MIKPSNSFIIMNRDGDRWGGYETVEAAWKAVDTEVFYGFDPYSVAELIDRPRPTPPRPELTIRGTVFVWSHGLYRTTEGGTYAGAAYASTFLSSSYKLMDEDTVALFELRADSETWDAKYTEPVPPAGADDV